MSRGHEEEERLVMRIAALKRDLKTGWYERMKHLKKCIKIALKTKVS